MARLSVLVAGREPINFNYPNDEIAAQAIEGIRDDFAKAGGSMLSVTTGTGMDDIKAALMWVPRATPLIFEFDGPVPQSLASQMAVDPRG